MMLQEEIYETYKSSLDVWNSVMLTLRGDFSSLDNF